MAARTRIGKSAPHLELWSASRSRFGARWVRMLLVVACLLVSAAARVAAGAVPAGGNAQTGSASQTNLEKASSYAQIVGVGGALIALGLIVWQVREARKEARHHRATAILARFNAPEFKDSWSRAFAFLDADSIRDRTGLPLIWLTPVV